LKLETLPTGREFRSRFLLIVSMCGSISALVVLSYLVLLLRMPAEQVSTLAAIVSFVFLCATPVCIGVYRRVAAPVVTWLDALRERKVDGTVEADAFEAIINMPTRVLGLSFTLFVVPASISVAGLLVFFEELGLYQFLLMEITVFSGGALASIVKSALLKRWLLTLRSTLTLTVRNPAERSELTRPVSLVTKLQAVITVCSLVPVVLTGLVAQTRSDIPVERFTNSFQQHILERALDDFEDYGAEGLAQLDYSEVALAIEATVLALDRSSGTSVWGRDDILSESEMSSIRNSTGQTGVGEEMQGDNLYVWQNTPSGKYAIVVASPRTVMAAGETSFLGVFAGLAIACLGLGLGVGWLVAQDVGGATRSLGLAADRMASGDLRRLGVLESEDELGTLGRSFDSMASALRESVGDVAETADEIEKTSGTIATVATELLATAEAQGVDVKQVVEAMDAVESQASDIARSSDELRHLVAESTTSILELGAAGDQLNGTAGSLSERVEEVAATVDQTVKSVRAIGDETGSLADAANDTSSSMEEMATAMRHVDETAVETAALSEQVVVASEFGYEKVRATIEGIESIRTATSTAQSVIIRLGARTQEIGGIVDVIDDVAEETNLLALNAAIIAAQAGEHGKAFSVVAEEIKELADRVLASTKEISGLIQSVQGESQSAIDAMEEGSRSVAEGVALSSEAGESLEEITRISRDSGLRIREIVDSVQEQTKAAGHVVGLMEMVRSGVDSIQNAAGEQERGNERVFDATQTMREVAQQLHLTTNEQASGLARLRESVSGVNDQMQTINQALQRQSASTNHVVEFLEEVSSRSVANERAARLMGDSTSELAEKAIRLRSGMGRFQRS
jgi:methyl-accepting chemotaxis protein